MCVLGLTLFRTPATCVCGRASGLCTNFYLVCRNENDTKKKTKRRIWSRCSTASTVACRFLLQSVKTKMQFCHVFCSFASSPLSFLCVAPLVRAAHLEVKRCADVCSASCSDDVKSLVLFFARWFLLLRGRSSPVFMN